jgi:DNA repair exonuclease SbcCD nuclease subunit
MPIFHADLSSRCCYAALGHLHSGRNLARRDGERLTAYAGSPVATSRRELGPRATLVVDVEPGAGVLSHEVVPIRTPYYERVEVSCTPGEESAAIDRLAREAVALRRPGARVIARLTGVAMEPEAAMRSAGERALAQAWESAAGALPTRAIDEIDASSPELELAMVSFAQLAEVAVVREFIGRVRARLHTPGPAVTFSSGGAGASQAAGAEAATLHAALRLGLGAFLESLP